MEKKGAFVAIVVGGTSGIGLSTVKLFLKRGVSVVVADIDEGRGTAVERDLTSRGYTVTFVKASVTDDDSLNNMIAKAASIYGKIDFAVNTAGVTGPQVEGHLLKDPDWYKVISTDLEGTWRFSKAIITYFRSQEHRLVRHDVGPYWGPVFQRGSLVNIASSLGSEGKAYLAVYCAAKHGFIGLSKTLALENAEWGIRVNTISPGLTMTPIMQEEGFDFERAKTEYLADQPMQRFAHPDEIAAGIVFTAMDGASFMTGSDWGPDGGHHVH